jgi:NADPH:quinone reductase-like Zn-dependent oxidoreductase
MKVFELQNSFGLDNLRLTERPQPSPGHGEVLLKLRALSLNYRDLMVVKGQYNPRMKLPCIPLSDGVGEVVEVGPGVSLKPGVRVAGLFAPGWREGPVDATKSQSALGAGIDGLLAEYAVLPETGVIAVPEHLSDEEAATLPCAAVTAWNALFVSATLKPGETVLLQGTGGVSLFALQFAHAAGAKVILTSSSDAKIERARALGANECINYKTTPEWGKKVVELTGGVGVDHVVEVGGAGTLGQSIRAVRTGGHIALIGVLTSGGEVNPISILMKSVRVSGIFVGSGAMFAEMNRAIALHKLRPVVDRVFAFDQVVEALRHMEGASHFGKIVIRV